MWEWAGGACSGWGWGWGGVSGLGLARHPTHTYTSALGPPDLKPRPQASKASTAPSDAHPAVERVQPVMASDIPATPGRTG